MARHRRVVRPNAPHQITVRGNNKRRIFSYPSDYRRFIRYLADALEETACLMHQLTLMPNHLHMISTPPTEAALSRMMKLTLQRYARSRNLSRASCGKLFEQRFFSRVIDEEAYLIRATLYNDANLFRAGLIRDPIDHEWSTCAIHAGVHERSAVPARMWTPSTWYASLGSPDARPAHYCVALREYMSANMPGDPAVMAYEQRATEPYTRRVQRPDGSSAREPKMTLTRKSEE